MPKILIIEDEPDILKTMRMLLEMHDYEVITAQDGIEGLNKARKQNPDLIILDLMIPKLDGYRILRMLKFDDKFKFIPIAVVTARIDKEDEKAAYDAGANFYIAKPYEHGKLLETIKRLLDSEDKALR